VFRDEETMSEIEDIFRGLPAKFVKGNLRSRRSFYFSLGDDEKWTVVLTPEACEVKPGQNGDSDYFFKGSKEMFLDVWNGRYTPTVKDFLNGAIRSNNPLALKDFVDAFRKKA
jgi:putative sterol carrier protein